MVYSGASGIMTAIAILTNRYRILLLPLFALILEVYAHRSKTEKYRRSPFRYPVYVLFAVVGVFAYQGLLYLLILYGIHIPSYFYSLKQSMAMHSIASLDPLSFLTYPFFIVRFEGWIFFLLFISSSIFFRKKRSSLFPFVIVLLQMIVSSIVDARAIRNISVVLPFIAMSCALAVYHIYAGGSFGIKRKKG